MKTMTYTESRARYAEVLDQVATTARKSSSPGRATRASSSSPSTSTSPSWRPSTSCSPPANARHLRESIAQLRHGNLEEHDLIDIPDEEN